MSHSLYQPALPVIGGGEEKGGAGEGKREGKEGRP